MKRYRNTKYGTKIERRNYSKMNYDVELPNLIKTQTESFKSFLTDGIKEALADISPIISYNGDLKLYFDDFFLKEPKLSEREAKKRDFSYCSELFVNVRLENVFTGEVKKSTVLMLELPLMTASGTFIINGTERVVISQIVRSSGVYFTQKLDVKTNKIRLEGQIIPTRGFWIEYEQSNKDILYAKLDRSKKISLTKFMRVLGFDNREQIENVFGKNEILDLSFEKDDDSNSNNSIIELYSKLHQGEKVSANVARDFIRARLFDRRKYDLSLVGRYKVNKKLDVLSRVENTFLAEDIKNHQTNEIIFAKNTILTKEVIQELRYKRQYFRKILINDETNLEKDFDSDILIYKTKDSEKLSYFNCNILNTQTGEILITQNTLFDDEAMNILETNKNFLEDKIVQYFFVKVNDSNNLKKSFNDENNKVLNETLEIYIFDNKGNKKFIKVIGNNQDEKREHIVLSDIIASISYYLNLYDDIGNTDDIDYLGNRRLRLIKELLKNQFRIGLMRSDKNIKDRMSVIKFENITPGGLFNFSPLSAVIKTFFGSSRLSHFMDQINPLSELTQKRRISALGAGGIDRDRAGVEIRDVHNSYYGRLCSIETPEGPSIGLISSLSTYAQIDKYGFIQTPFLKVIHRNGIAQVSNEHEYLTPMQEEGKIIASADSLLDNNNVFQEEKAFARKNGETGFYSVDQIDYIDVSPKQIVSVATSSIPFLEHNDASRALMGTNMQRQALPLLIPEAPIVATGIEHRIAKDSGCSVIAKEDGYVYYVDACKIVIQEKTGTKSSYDLINFAKSNQNNLILQKPIVKKKEYVRKGDIIADGPAISQGELALGKNITVAFMTWDGYNYEDAIIISENLVQQDIYTSIHINKYEIHTRELKKGAGEEKITREIPNVSAEYLKNLDERGIIIPGSEVKEGDILVGKVIPQGILEPTPYEKLIQTIIGEKARDYKDVSLRVPFREQGIVQSVEYFSTKNGDNLAIPGVNEIVRVYIAKKRKIKEGDKMAGRHGNKGVISRILPKEDLPYMADGTPIDIMLNPLGVPSRMNIGQILEMHLGFACKKLGIKVSTPVFDGVNNEDLKVIMQEANLPLDGKMILYNGRTGEPYDKPIAVGTLYMIKLSHMVDDKLHVRNVGPYTLITNQATRGQGHSGPGGQRIGEMEVWSLYGYGAAHTLQEFLTIKSDDMIGRNKTYNSIVNGLPLPKPSIPESFRVFSKELQSLGLHVELIQNDTKKNKVHYSLVEHEKEK
ncbi:DNA-directed RNA polymerase subunit beta [Candidatus Phytoplasma pini]|uniref:DNA-directed RNA polymerase subunit beta n=1 Tax=Candidatus Phytoplasma pini TaxID=267362 RepID=A0A559KJI0_9MOLU|nr:DNA-directed RNA polymerase subunit beta [Candidatus Phytoplasma pini]TVY12295.1 DNA-directed RNA polymerase subunit beta [Candidatus Phytoplasma pini]